MRLNEILEELECTEDEPLPDFISILPPENFNADVTDEDSGDENQVFMQNLPGSQLRVQAIVHYNEPDISESDDDEDSLSLADLAKLRQISAEQDVLNMPSTSHQPPTQLTKRRKIAASDQENQPNIPTPPIPEKPVVSKTKSYMWTSRDIRPIQRPWIEKQGPQNINTPLYYFDCLFDEDTLNIILKYTNLYCATKNNVGNVTINELKCFLGVLLLSGYINMPRRYMYWENATDCSMPIIYNAITRDRFTYIMTHLHCCDNKMLSVNDKFTKVRPLFDKLNSNFVNYAPFEENHSIDEAMVPYYGGHPCKQFIRGKPIRWGYKFWVGSTRLGYIIWFEPYQGQSTEIPNEYKKAGLGASVILQYADVLRKIDGQASFHLFFDNFFTSIPLIDELGERGLKATGTIRENRLSKCPLPSNKELQKTDRGTYRFQSARSEQIVVCKWHDNSVVTVASNAVKVLPTNEIKRFSQKEKKYIKVEQPATIKAYNENMGGVDRSDENIGLYRTSIRGKKWYFSIICHCLDMAVHNAWQLYKKDGGDYDHLRFRRTIATSLLETYKKPSSRKGCRSSKGLHEESRYDHIDHIIIYDTDRHRCKICHIKANFICKKCKVYLHPKICFEKYHTSDD